MQDDNSADVTTIDDDIADLPLFGDNTQPEATPEAAEAPSTESNEATKEADSTEDAKQTDDKATDANNTEATEPSTEDAQKTDEQPAKGQPDPELARQRYLEQRQTRQAVEQQIDQTYAPKSQDELYQENIDKGMDEQQANVQAQIQAMREEMQYNQQRTYIAELNAGMQAEAVNAMSDFPVFNEKSSDYDPDFTRMVEAQYKTAARLQYIDTIDPITGETVKLISNAEVPLYEHYQQAWNMYNRGASKGASKAQAETTETLSRVESVSGGGSSTSRGPETLEEMGERLANMPLI